MPTNVSGASGYNEAIKAERSAELTVMLLSLVACLANLVLVAVSPTFAAAVAAMGQY